MAATLPVAINPLPMPKPAPREVAGFKPCPWGDLFLDYTPDTKVIEAQEKMAKELKEELKKELQSLGDKPLMEQLSLIDSIERLGVAYHFEEEIEDALRRIHEGSTNTSFDDLALTSLFFRLLRQHGYRVSSDVFEEFIGSDGSLKEEVTNDVRALLSFYEACHLRLHEDGVLDEALSATKSILINLISDIADPLSNSLEESIRHALNKPLNKRLVRLESVHYMQVYGEDDPLHNKTLLKFAKIDFNLLQGLHKQELSEMCRWWKRVNMTRKMALRDRMVESYFWGSAVYYEPQFSFARKWPVLGCQILTTMDDLYDAYGTLEELQIFTDALDKWDESCLDQLPEDLGWTYKTLILDAHEEMERDFAPKGRSQYVYYAKEEIRALCHAYFTEAKWRHKKYIPTFDEYMEFVYRNMGYLPAVVYSFLDMDMATEAEFDWICSLPKPIKSLCVLLRILNDIGGNMLVENREHPCLILECYKKQYGVSHEGACKMLYEKIDELWKDLNEAMMQPTEIPMPLVKCILNLARAVEAIYDAGEDGFTTTNRAMKDNIRSLYIDPIPI